MTGSNKMICQNCSAEMNHHAEKIDETDALDALEGIDPVLGGLVKEVHTCPQCGTTELRTADHRPTDERRQK